MRAEEEVDQGWRSKSICQVDLVGLGGGCIVGQVLHVKTTQQKYILGRKIQAEESSASASTSYVSVGRIQSPQHDLPKVKFFKFLRDPLWDIGN